MTEKTQAEIIEMVMPTGQEYLLPEEWRAELSDSWRKESPSSIVSFLGCPLKWYLERYNNDVPGSPSGFPTVLGTFVHRILEVFFTEPPQNRTPDLLERTFKTAWRIMTDHEAEPTGIIDSGLQHDFYILEEMELERLDKAVEDGNIELREGDENAHGIFYGSFYKRAKTAVDAIVNFDGETLEDVQVVSREQWVNLTSNGIKVNGKIDRVIRDDSGAIVIQDYKTGKAPELEDAILRDENGEPITLQGTDGNIYTMSSSFTPMGIYALMMKDQFDGETIKLQLYYLAKNVKYVIGMDQARLELTQALVDETTERMNKYVAAGYLPANKVTETVVDDEGNESEVPSGPCTWCFASDVCPAYVGGTLEDMRTKLKEMYSQEDDGDNDGEE